MTERSDRRGQGWEAVGAGTTEGGTQSGVVRPVGEPERGEQSSVWNMVPLRVGAKGQLGALRQGLRQESSLAASLLTERRHVEKHSTKFFHFQILLETVSSLSTFQAFSAQI